MKRALDFHLLPGAAFIAVACLVQTLAEAAVVVLANYTETDVEFRVSHPRASGSQEYIVHRGALLPIPAHGELWISFDSGVQRHEYALAVDSAYYFCRDSGELRLRQISFSAETGKQRPPSPSARTNSDGYAEVAIGGVPSFYRMNIVPVVILVDDDQPMTRALWEPELRQRLEKASNVLQQYCGMGFRAVSVRTWESDRKAKTFSELLRDFERKVDPTPAAMAIGFTSQPVPPDGDRAHLGGVRGPLCRHLLVQERSRPRTEPERLEVLVHELGHFLGAVHSRDTRSVMRSLLADGQAGGPACDVANVLIMNLVAEEMRTRGIEHFLQLRPATRGRLREIYSAVATVLPDDVAAKKCLSLLDRSDALPAAPDH